MKVSELPKMKCATYMYTLSFASGRLISLKVSSARSRCYAFQWHQASHTQFHATVFCFAINTDVSVKGDATSNKVIGHLDV